MLVYHILVEEKNGKRITTGLELIGGKKLQQEKKSFSQLTEAGN
jgi:hypothetical protein